MSKPSKKLLLKYLAHFQVILRDMHFFGLQAAEDLLEGKITLNQYEGFMSEVEASLNRYLILIRQIKKFPSTSLPSTSLPSTSLPSTSLPLTSTSTSPSLTISGGSNENI